MLGPSASDEPTADSEIAKVGSHDTYVKSEAYLPVLCSACLRTYLLPAASGTELSCRECGGTASVVPGETYGEGDIPLFERVSAAVDSGLRSAQAARQIVAELRDARHRSDPPEANLLRVVDELPGLGFLIPALYAKRITPAHRVQIARGLGMVLTLVAARLRCFEAGSTGKTPAH
jgi:hypothetical protein